MLNRLYETASTTRSCVARASFQFEAEAAVAREHQRVPFAAERESDGRYCQLLGQQAPPAVALSTERAPAAIGELERSRLHPVLLLVDARCIQATRWHCSSRPTPPSNANPSLTAAAQAPFLDRHPVDSLHSRAEVHAYDLTSHHAVNRTATV